jgi:hypothetical protein
MTLLATVVRKRELPDYRYYVEITTTGMRVTCRVIENRGSFTITREMFTVQKSEHKWLDKIELFYKVACEHYPSPVKIVGNANKAGFLGG